MWFPRQSVYSLLRSNSSLSIRQEVQLSLRLLTQDCRSSKSNILDDETFCETTPKIQTKVIKVALIGRPNVGKSTLINQIVGRTTCAVSMKAHTTRLKVKAFTNDRDTQIVFLDTPGLVTPDELKKYKFDPKFLRSAEEAIQEADIWGVIHDVSLTRNNSLDPALTRLLLLYQRKSSFLVLNKVDAIKKKHSLLKLVELMTRKPKCDIIDATELTEQEVSDHSSKISSWPHFSEVFMISALQGDGVGDIKEYLLNEARPGQWLITGNEVLNPKALAVDLVKAACLDYLQDEVPYRLECRLNYFEDYEEQCAVEVSIIPAKKRHERMILDKVRYISKYAEAQLASALEKECRLLVNVEIVEESK